MSFLGEHLRALVRIPVNTDESSAEEYLAIRQVADVFEGLPKVIVGSGEKPRLSGEELATMYVKEGLLALGASRHDLRIVLDPWRKHLETKDNNAAVKTSNP